MCGLSILLPPIPLHVFLSGEWLSPDFSQCRLKAGTAPFVLLWITFRSAYTRHWQDSYIVRIINEVCWEVICEYLHVLPYVCARVCVFVLCVHVPSLCLISQCCYLLVYVLNSSCIAQLMHWVHGTGLLHLAAAKIYGRSTSLNHHRPIQQGVKCGLWAHAKLQDNSAN